MKSISTNDVFHHFILLLRLTKEADLIIEMFSAQGISASKSKIKAWQTRSPDAPAYREMQRSTLDAFIDELYKRKLVEE